MKWTFIVLVVFLLAIVFCETPISTDVIERLFENYTPPNYIMHVDSVSFGLRRGLHVRGLKIYDSERANPTEVLAGADEIHFYPILRRLRVIGARYPRLPDSYYAPGNLEKNQPVECVLPELGKFTLELERPDILAVTPSRVRAEVEVLHDRVLVDRIRLDWPDIDEERMYLDGFCHVDFTKQEIRGEVRGTAKQKHIRPMLVALDVPVALPYFDGFTEVPGKVPASCGWQVNLINNDFDLFLDLHPTLGKYNLVPMKHADGKIHLHIYTRGTSLNYLQTIGPIEAVGLEDRPLKGTVIVSGTNGYNRVEVNAESGLPIADILKIGGFTGDYVGEEVFGDSKCKLEFRFPRAMTNNYEVLNGEGHIVVRNGQLMRMKGFRGLIAAMPSMAPAVSWFTDSTQASCDYVIENGVVKSDNIYIEGSLFSIKMYGEFNAVTGELDYTARVQFTKKDSMIGKILHPLTWPFTKLLLEFKLTGTPDNPKWSYITVIDRVWEAVK